MKQLGEHYQAPDEQLWQNLATDPVMVAAELAVIELEAISRENLNADHAVRQYYWNTGLPYTTEHGGIPGDTIPYSYAWDRPVDNGRIMTVGSPRYTEEQAKGRFLNDPIIDIVSQRPVPELGLAIVQSSTNKSYLVNNEGRALSAGYGSITHLGGNDFAIPGHQGQGTLHLLTQKEQQVALQQRAHAEAVHELWQERVFSGVNHDKMVDVHETIITHGLEKYGVAVDDTEFRKSVNSLEVQFDYAGKHVRLSAMNGTLEVITWDERMTSRERTDVWHAYESGNMEGVTISMLQGYLDSEIPEYLKPYEDQIMDDVETFNAEKRTYMQQLKSFSEQFCFLKFTLYSDRISWSLPVAMAFAAMDAKDSFPMVGKMQPGGSDQLAVTQPGQCSAGPEQRKLRFVVESDTEMRREETGAQDRALSEVTASIMQGYVEAKQVAAKAAKELMPTRPYKSLLERLAAMLLFKPM